MISKPQADVQVHRGGHGVHPLYGESFYQPQNLMPNDTQILSMSRK